MDNFVESSQENAIPSEDLVQVKVQGSCIPVKKELLLKVPYFAAMFKGSWLENQEGTVTLDCGYETANLVLAHISGNLSFEDLVSEMAVLVDLVRLADMLGLAELLAFISRYFKQKLFHDFHKPCSECIHSTLDYLTVLTLYNITPLQNEALDWISHHFKDIWPTQSFAELSITLKELCLNRKVSTLRAGHVLDTIVDCDVVLRRLPSVKWAQAVTDVTQELKTNALRCLSCNLVAVLNSPRFVKLKLSGEMDLSRVDSVLLQACQEVEVDQACRSLTYLQKWLDPDYEEHFRNFLEKMIETLKGNIKKNVRKARACPSWSGLTSSTQEELLQSALFLPWEDNQPTRPPSVRLPSKNVRSIAVKSRPSSTPAISSRNTVSSQAPSTRSSQSAGTSRSSSQTLQTNQRGTSGTLNRSGSRSATPSNAQGKPKPPVWR